MKEPVTQPKHTWIVGIALAGVAVAYFVLLGSSDFPEPGANIEYDLEAFAALDDDVESAYDEAGTLKIDVTNPRALAVADGKIYVGAEGALLVLDEAGAEQARHAIDGTANCLAVDADGTIYAGLRTQLVVLDAAGNETAVWDAFTSRSYLTSIVLDGEDVYVADAGKRVVCRFNRAGDLLTRIGEKDEARDVPGLEVPSPYLDIALNPDGDLWVVNPGELGLERYRSDGSIVTSWYRPSFTLEGFPGCCNPTHIAFDPDGRLIACEKGLVRVKRFEVTRGEFEGLVASAKQFPGEQSMRDLVVDDLGRVLILDGQRGVVRVFTRKEQADATTLQSQ